MEQKDIDVYEILKDVPKGTEFYTSLCGNVGLAYLESNKEAGEAIWTKNKDGEYSFNKNGRWMKGGEVTFFPSKQMRDWSKFFKKGDVLEYAGDDEGLQGSCTFEKFEDETKTRFLGRYVKEKEALYSKRPSSLRTADWVKSDDPADYIRFVEERLGGKLNRETLEIEKQLEFKDGDIVALVVRKCTHIAIFQSRQEAYIGFHAVLCQNDELLLEEPFREDVGDIELRLATDSEKQQLFDALAKEGKAWDAEKKQIVDLKLKWIPKPFDKVVVRCGKADKWSIDFFSYKVSNGYICTGDAWFGYCLPYNEETAHLLGTTDDWEGGEQ